MAKRRMLAAEATQGDYGIIPRQKYSRVSVLEDRQAMAEILQETKKVLPDYFTTAPTSKGDNRDGSITNSVAAYSQKISFVRSSSDYCT